MWKQPQASVPVISHGLTREITSLFQPCVWVALYFKKNPTHETITHTSVAHCLAAFLVFISV